MTGARAAARSIDVAAAVILQDDGRFLLAKRPAGREYAGYWEFPGGKIEDGEGALNALARELHEELGIDVDDASTWLTRTFDYPDKSVRLHFYRVWRWRGVPRGREGQELAWQSPDAAPLDPLLPANGPVLKALTLPPVYAITSARHGISTFLNRMQVALERGVRLIQVREPEMSPIQLEKFALQVIKLGHLSGARVLINGDVDMAARINADGVHLQAGQLKQVGARPKLPLVAASCHDAAELARAAALGCDFAVLSPVLPTASHPGAPALGWDAFESLVRDRPLPVYALGGMRAEHLPEAIRRGGHGIGQLSGVW